MALWFNCSEFFIICYFAIDKQWVYVLVEDDERDSTFYVHLCTVAVKVNSFKTNFGSRRLQKLGLYWIVDFIIRPTKNTWNYYSAEYE